MRQAELTVRVILEEGQASLSESKFIEEYRELLHQSRVLHGSPKSCDVCYLGHTTQCARHSAIEVRLYGVGKYCHRLHLTDELAVFQHQFEIGKRVRPFAIELDVDYMATDVLKPSCFLLDAFVQWAGDIHFISVVTKCLEYFLSETVKSAPAVAEDKNAGVIGGHRRLICVKL